MCSPTTVDSSFNGVINHADYYSFTANMTQHLFGRESTAFSPASLSIVLTFLYLGGGLRERNQIANVLFGKQTDVDSVYKFIQELESLEYPSTNQKINAWVENTTRGLIRDFLKPIDLHPLSEIILINTLYLKSNWAVQLQKKFLGLDFFAAANKIVKTEAMETSSSETFHYYDNNDIEAMEMDLDVEGAAVLFVLPKEKNSLEEVRTRMSEHLPSIFNGLRERLLQVTIPTFKLEAEPNIQEALSRNALGFSSSVQLPNLIYPENTTVKVDIKQKVVLEITNAGIEAAAVTAAIMDRFGPSDDDSAIQFIANHPFLFYVTHKVGSDRVVLFAGQFTGI